MSPSPVSRRPASGRAAAGVAPRAVSVLPGARPRSEGGGETHTVVRSTRSAAEAAEKEEVLNPLRSGDGTTVRRRTRRPDPRHPRRSPARDRLQGHHAPARPPAGLASTIEALADPWRDAGIDTVVGIEARGFILGAAVAHSLGVGFVPIRKAGKLPGATMAQQYDLEYGTDTIEIHADAVSPGEHVLVLDDVLATGGTAAAAALLLQRLGAPSPVTRSCSNCRSSTGEPSSAMLVSRR